MYKYWKFISLISLIISIIVFYCLQNQSFYTYKGSELPGQFGIKINETKSIMDADKKGFLSYGPYIELPSGTFQCTLLYTSVDAKNSKIDIVSNGGEDILIDEHLNQTASRTSAIYKINIDKANKKWEMRVWYDGKGQLSVHSITIEKVFGYAELKKYIIYFLVTFVFMVVIVYLYTYSKPIMLFFIMLLFLLVAFLFVDIYQRYYSYKSITYKDMPFTKDMFFYYLDQSIKSQIAKYKAQPYQHDDTLDTYNLIVEQKELDALNADLPSSGMEQYVDARLKINNEINTKVKLRYRGGSQWNYSFKRKSLKIKFLSSDSYRMDKIINLSVLYSPALYTEPISQYLASKVGILAPKVKPIKMFINGEYAGLYLYLEQIDESFLRKNKLMPGSLYSGDYQYDKPVPVDKEGIPLLWRESKLWKKSGARNAEQKENQKYRGQTPY